MISDKTLSIVAFSSDFGKVHYALSIAAAASATNTSVTMMFTMGAIRALITDDSDHPGWSKLPNDGKNKNGGAQDKMNQARGVAGFEELLEACISMDVTFLICEMGLEAADISKEQLRKDISYTPGGLVTFLNSASTNGQILFI